MQCGCPRPFLKVSVHALPRFMRMRYRRPYGSCAEAVRMRRPYRDQPLTAHYSKASR